MRTRPLVRGRRCGQRPVVFLLIAYAFSADVVDRRFGSRGMTDAGDLLFNQDFVWRVGFVRDVLATPVLVATGIAFPAVRADDRRHPRHSPWTRRSGAACGGG